MKGNTEAYRLVLVGATKDRAEAAPPQINSLKEIIEEITRKEHNSAWQNREDRAVG